MLLLGVDVGTSSIKVSVVDGSSHKCIATAQYPDTESAILAVQPGWAEQAPEMWWEHVQAAIIKLHAKKKYNPLDIGAIGIAYQMHGLVMIDKEHNVLRPSIIWCDSRAVEIGEQAFEEIGQEKCLTHLLNSPGNFTASKLAWVKKNEPALYAKADKIMLPGDYIAMKLTGHCTTSISALSEGIFWDFQANEVSKDVMSYYGFAASLLPEIKNVFTEHGKVSKAMAEKLSLQPGIPVSYKAGDQPNNALALNVLQPGEVAATAGTSGVIYGVSDALTYDKESRVNTFAHVNYTTPGTDDIRVGVLLCINGTGILNRWVKNMAGGSMSYPQINEAAKTVTPGSNGLTLLPFGNGAERMLNNKTIDAHIQHIDFNKHNAAHLFRAAQEGIAFAFRYGLDIMRENGMQPAVIRASQANLFLSDVFTTSFANVNKVAVEFYEGDGSYGAAIGAGIGVGFYASAKEAGDSRKPVATVEPAYASLYSELYEKWKETLQLQLGKTNIKTVSSLLV